MTALSAEDGPAHRTGANAAREKRPRRVRRLPPLVIGTAAVGGFAATAALLETYRARKAEQNNPPRGDFLEIDGVRLHYLDRGPSAGALPAVLLHGNGSMVEDWMISGVIDLIARDRRIVAFDRPGFGHSERPRDRSWTPQAQADLFHQAFVHLGLERPIVVGHSFGALVALALALKHPEAMAGLVLISGYYYPSARMDVPIFAPPAIPVLGDALRYTIAPAIGRMIAPAMIRRMFAPRPTPARFKAAFPLALGLRPSQIRATAEDTAFMVPAAAELQHGYASVEAPITIIAGAGDTIVDVAKQPERLHRDIPHSDLKLVHGVGHMLQYAAPELIADATDAISVKVSRKEASSEAPASKVSSAFP